MLKIAIAPSEKYEIRSIKSPEGFRAFWIMYAFKRGLNQAIAAVYKRCPRTTIPVQPLYGRLYAFSQWCLHRNAQPLYRWLQLHYVLLG